MIFDWLGLKEIDKVALVSKALNEGAFDYVYEMMCRPVWTSITVMRRSYERRQGVQLKRLPNRERFVELSKRRGVVCSYVVEEGSLALGNLPPQIFPSAEYHYWLSDNQLEVAASYCSYFELQCSITRLGPYKPI